MLVVVLVFSQWILSYGNSAASFTYTSTTGLDLLVTGNLEAIKYILIDRAIDGLDAYLQGNSYGFEYYEAHASALGSLNISSLQFPIEGRKFGNEGFPSYPKHNGRDIMKLAVGTAVLAPWAGTVIGITNVYNDKSHLSYSNIINQYYYLNTAGNGYGNSITILVEYKFIKYEITFAHLNSFGPYKVGDEFKKGDTLGYSGNTGQSGGPHLHVTVKIIDKNGKIKVIDPKNFY